MKRPLTLEMDNLFQFYLTSANLRVGLATKPFSSNQTQKSSQTLYSAASIKKRNQISARRYSAFLF